MLNTVGFSVWLPLPSYPSSALVFKANSMAFINGCARIETGLSIWNAQTCRWFYPFESSCLNGISLSVLADSSVNRKLKALSLSPSICLVLSFRVFCFFFSLSSSILIHEMNGNILQTENFFSSSLLIKNIWLHFSSVTLLLIKFLKELYIPYLENYGGN